MPRWAFSLYWRRDGVPIWRNDGLIAREAAALDPLPDDAQRFAEGIAARIGITADYVQPAYEDPADRMLKQGLIPENVDPSDPKIDDPDERARIAEIVRWSCRPAGRLRAAAAALDSAGKARMAERAMANAARPAVPYSGRFAARLPAAAARAAPPGSRRRSASRPGRPVRRTSAAAGSARHPSDQAAGAAALRPQTDRRRSRPTCRRCSARRAQPPRSLEPICRCAPR